MANPTTLQEIILVTDSGFANRPYAENNSEGSSKKHSQKEKLIDACWSGFIKELLPELFLNNSQKSTLFLWQLRECGHILTLELSAERQNNNPLFSIDPYLFFYYQPLN
ncbi:MAG: hypothetical protein KF829_06570 [Ferruginibacter sp.]|nr:hypothetical protein [Ferruginibacter sp.]